MPKVLESLNDYQTLLIALLCVAAVWLLLRDMGYGVKKDGFYNKQYWGFPTYLSPNTV